MTTEKGVTWTDPPETLLLMEVFRAKHGGTEAEPKCGFCGRMTEYVVEDFPITRPGFKMIMALARMPLIVHDGKAYIPVTGCLRCGAKYDGVVAGAGGRERSPQDLPLTSQEAHEFFETYSLAKYRKEEEVRGEVERAKAAKFRRASTAGTWRDG